MKHINVHLLRKSNFLKSSTFLSFRCPKWNVWNAVQILLLVSDHKRGNNVWGFPLVRSHKLVTCTQDWNSYPEVPRTQIRIRCPSVISLCASQITCGFDNLWFIKKNPSFWRFWWYWAIQAGLLTPLTFARHRLSPLAAFSSGAYFLHNGRRWQRICEFYTAKFKGIFGGP